MCHLDHYTTRMTNLPHRNFIICCLLLGLPFERTLYGVGVCTLEMGVTCCHCWSVLMGSTSHLTWTEH
jgi:hypothetical protein